MENLKKISPKILKYGHHNRSLSDGIFPLGVARLYSELCNLIDSNTK